MGRTRAIGDQGLSLLTNDLGDFAFLAPAIRSAYERGSLDPASAEYMDLQALGLLGDEPRSSAGLEDAVRRTRKAFLLEGPSLHIFVVTLRCDHSCHYCQVSRAAVDAACFDMSADDAEAALDRVFESPAQALTIEFQGGEPTLRMDLVRRIVASAEARNEQEARDISFTMVTTLHHLSDEDLEFCRDHKIHLSTSIDGPAALHDRHRPNPSHDSHARTVEGLARAREILGHDGIAALPTLTRAALADPRAVIDAYRDLGFASIFLRPVSPYGFAAKTRRVLGYEMADFITFYRQALAYVLELNQAGEAFEETYAAILLRHILTPFHSGYLDLRSPAGAGLGVLVYNYDGLVYPSDEARMAARTGDGRFALGPVTMPLDGLLASPAIAWLRTGAVAEELPGCRDCAYVPYCGADPVHHAIIDGDPIGDRATSEFCQKSLGVFDILFEHLAAGNVETRRTFEAWAFRRPRAEILPTPGIVR